MPGYALRGLLQGSSLPTEYKHGVMKAKGKSMTNDLPVPLAERRMCRFLWKVIHIEEHGWIVPTKHLIAALLMSGRIGFPRTLYEPLLGLASAGLRASNRVVYENPRYFITTLYPLSIEQFVNPCRALDSVQLLYQYDDQFGDGSLISKLGLDVQRLERAFQSQAKVDMDLIDKFTADRVEAHLDTKQFPQFLAAVIQAAVIEHGFPLVLHPAICIQELQRLDQSAHLLVSLEQELSSHLPDRVLTFADLLAPTLHEKRTPLRRLVERIASGEVVMRDPSVWEQAISYSSEQVSTTGIPYQAVALGDVKDLPDHPEIPRLDLSKRLPWLYDVDTADSGFQQMIEQDNALGFHRAIWTAKCVGSSSAPLEMLFLFSKSSGFALPSIADMIRAMGGLGLESSDVIGGRVPVM